MMYTNAAHWCVDLLERSVREGASDIHLECVATGLRVRARIHGQLEPTSIVPVDCSSAIRSYFKVLADMDLGQMQLPQDGRAFQMLCGRRIDLRVSCVPTYWGESITVRILDPLLLEKGLAQLGLSSDDVAILQGQLGRPGGLWLMAGPTGSGKTTTMYALLRELVAREEKILTAEDPVEYTLPGTVQLGMHPYRGLDFSDALAFLLRHDPDTLMIGEIRDEKTAAIAIQAALTGHRVLTTVHAPDGPSSITRITELGIPEYALRQVLRMVISQRLVRVTCPGCSGTGCMSCRATGCCGRVGEFNLWIKDGEGLAQKSSIPR